MARFVSRPWSGWASVVMGLAAAGSTRLRLTQSAHYNLSLMVPLFDPGPIEHSDISIHVAAVRCARARSSWPCSRGRRGGRRCPRASATRCSTPTRWSAPRKLVARYRGLVTDVEFSIPAITARE